MSESALAEPSWVITTFNKKAQGQLILPGMILFYVEGAWAMLGEWQGGLTVRCTSPRSPPPVLVSLPPSPPSPMVAEDPESAERFTTAASFRDLKLKIFRVK